MANFYNWITRLDRDGRPAGHYTLTPSPITEASTICTLVNDENPLGKTYVLGSKYFVDGARSDDSGDGLSLATAKKTITAAIAVAGSGNKTIIVRGAHDAFDGTYTETHFLVQSGVDDTHRWTVVGYDQERPIINGASEIYDTFGSAGSKSYVTMQRLKIMDNYRNGVRFGETDTYINSVDLLLYNNDKAKQVTGGTHDGTPGSTTELKDTDQEFVALGAWVNRFIYNLSDGSMARITGVSGNTVTHEALSGGAENHWDVGDQWEFWTTFADANLYYLGTSNSWVFHCTSQRGHGHGFKVGDVASYDIVEWSVAREAGYWVGILPTTYLHMAVTFDFPTDANDTHHMTLRYCIGSDSESHGLQMRRVQNFSVHHNEFYHCVHHDDIAPPPEEDGKLVCKIFGGWASGEFYSNIVRDPASAGCHLLYFGSDANVLAYTVYNNLFYSATKLAHAVQLGYGSVGDHKFYNNCIYGNTDDPAGLFYKNSDGGTPPTVDFENNILYQVGTGLCVEVEGAVPTHANNRYYFPAGSRGWALGTGESDGDPAWFAVPTEDYADTFCRPLTALAGANLSGTFAEDFLENVRVSWNMGIKEFFEVRRGRDDALSLNRQFSVGLGRN